MSSLGERQAEARAPVGPGVDRARCIRVFERGYYARAEVVACFAGKWDFEAKTERHAQSREFAQRAAMTEANAVVADRRCRGPARLRSRFFGKHPSQTRTT